MAWHSLTITVGKLECKNNVRLQHEDPGVKVKYNRGEMTETQVTTPLICAYAYADSTPGPRRGVPGTGSTRTSLR